MPVRGPGVVGAGVVQCHVGVGHALAVVCGFGGVDFLLPAATSATSPSMTKSVADSSVSGMSCATWAMRHWAGMLKSPASS